MANFGDRLKTYQRKRDFNKTHEPEGRQRRSGRELRYLIQKHAARRDHYDFRLEWGGALMSWAVPKGPSENPEDKRLAIRVEDHPIEYGKFEGTIPKGEYGGGSVMLWDRGTWSPDGDVDAGIKKGKLSFELHGERCQGHWALVRLRSRNKGDKDNWLLIKELDSHSKRKGKIMVERETTSVLSGRSMDEIALGTKVWHSIKSSNKANSVKNSRLKPKRIKKKCENQISAFVKPQLATLVDAPPEGAGWLHEIKYDGYRAVVALASGKVAIHTRNGFDWTDRFHGLVAPLAKLPCDGALIDGEIAVTDAKGHTDFGALQEALSNGGDGIGYYMFDLLRLDDRDLRDAPLLERKALLKALLKDAPSKGPLIYSDHLNGPGKKIFTHACDLQLEGIVSKRIDAHYQSGRTKSWLKSKCGIGQEFVVIGWRPSNKAGRPFSSLLLAVRDGNALRYAGRVGSGYSAQGLDDLAAEFESLACKNSPVQGVPPSVGRSARFLKPVLVAQIALRGWTRDGLIRQGSFKGMRSDKSAREIVRERPMTAAKAMKLRKDERLAGGDSEAIKGVRVTHPSRLLFATPKVSKRDLIAYYLGAADRMLPHLVERPISLVRCPRGSGKECFFQKHASNGFPKEFHRVSIRDKSGNDEYLYIKDVRGLLAAVQLGVLEIHTWGCHIDAVEKPDRLVFDFDPDEGLAFSKVRDAAYAMRGRLKKLGLESFPMVTGGKGIHVVVPLKRGHSWDAHKDFAEAIARVMASDEPDRYVVVMSKTKRKGKIFIDYLRNQRGATAIAPFSTRARAGAYAALPVSWRTLSNLKSAHPAEVLNAARFIAGRDAWQGYKNLNQVLPKVR
jgi:bifunctional non-homologous end joining protein LigD